jgi:hypothetical protein
MPSPPIDEIATASRVFSHLHRVPIVKVARIVPLLARQPTSESLTGAPIATFVVVVCSVIIVAPETAAHFRRNAV